MLQGSGFAGVVEQSISLFGRESSGRMGSRGFRMPRAFQAFGVRKVPEGSGSWVFRL